MERIRDKRPSGLGGNALRTLGLVFMAAGILGRGAIQTHLLGLGSKSMEELLEVLNSSDTAMGLVSISLVLQAIETCAVPIFALLLVNGMQHTSNKQRYFTRILVLALVTEVPYNLAMGGKLLDLGSRNPVFGLVLSMILLLFYQYYSEKGFGNTVKKVMVTVAAVIWGIMLRIDCGTAMVVIVISLWIMRDKPNYRGFVGAAAAMLCTIFSPFFLAAPMSFLAVHFYNGEESTTSRAVNYVAYPVMLLAVGLGGIFR